MDEKKIKNYKIYISKIVIFIIILFGIIFALVRIFYTFDIWVLFYFLFSIIYIIILSYYYIYLPKKGYSRNILLENESKFDLKFVGCMFIIFFILLLSLGFYTLRYNYQDILRSISTIIVAYGILIIGFSRIITAIERQ